MRASLPEIWVRLRSDADLKEFTDEDAAAILAGELQAYVIAIIEARDDENWNSPDEWVFLDSCGNYVAPPGNDNIYPDPRRIPDGYLRFYATDMWAYRLGIQPGSLFRYGGQVYVVMGLECEPFDLDPVGYATGHLVCRPTAGGAPVRMLPEDATRPVLELNA
ncbi:hypothetical protein [Streptomyces sp. NPDC088141]|uniref:hypothetical protein n=1 Tax=unclassified Streptomyces TaxID=2593676 RepID=UPI0034195167